MLGGILAFNFEICGLFISRQLFSSFAILRFYSLLANLILKIDISPIYLSQICEVLKLANYLYLYKINLSLVKLVWVFALKSLLSERPCFFCFEHWLNLFLAIYGA